MPDPIPQRHLLVIIFHPSLELKMEKQEVFSVAQLVTDTPGKW